MVTSGENPAERDSVVVKHLDELEHPWPQWILARKGLGVRSFGINVCELQPGEQITEHDETGRAQEEVFVTLAGNATLVVDGTESPMPEGTFARLDPEPRRYVVNHSNDVVHMLIVSAPVTSGYKPMDWA